MRLLIASALLVAATAAGLAAAQGQGAADVAALAEARREAGAATARAQQLEQQAARATGEAARARAAAEALAARIEAGEAEITSAETRLRMIEGLAAIQRARLAERQQPVVKLTAALQTMARRPSALALVQPGSLEDVVHVRSLLASTLPTIRARTAGLRADVSRANRLRAEAARAHTALLASRSELHDRRVALARLEAQQRQRSQLLAGSANLEADRALALGEEARELAQRIGTSESQRRLAARLADLPGPSPRPGATAPDERPVGARGAYRLPVEGRLLVGVGELSDGGVHARGLLFATAPGAEVVAPAAGTILHAARFRSYGEVVIIDHGGGWHSVITDLGSTNIEAGQRVRRGDRIGRAGSKEPRIGVELRRGGRPIAIAPLLAG
jgi:septal ring factor EnvC (AmiA/AmiB activator)